MRSLLALIILLFLFACNITPSTKITQAERDKQIKACEKTLLQYIQFRDFGPANKYGDLFTTDATFIVPKLRIDLKYRSQIEARLNKTLVNNKTIHMITSMDVESLNNNELISHSHFLLYLTPKDQTIPKTKIFNGRYEDNLKIIHSKCYIKNRTVYIDRLDTLQ